MEHTHPSGLDPVVACHRRAARSLGAGLEAGPASTTTRATGKGVRTLGALSGARDIWRAPAAERRADSASLCDVEPAFASAVPAGERRTAVRMLRVPLVALSPGMWRSPDVLQQALGLIVIDGFLLCSRGDLSGGHATLVGPGDLLDPRPAAEGRATWAVVLSGQAAVVDARLLVAARRWPLLMRVFTQLLFDATEEHGTRAGMLALPSVDRRLLALLDHDADRWGRATLAGRVLDLPLTHEALGRLVGARRPTVSLALARLHERRALSRDQRGRWVLPFVAEDQRRVRA